MKQRFRNKDQEVVYQSWIKASKETVDKILEGGIKSNRDLEFKTGYLNGKPPPKNSLAYAIYVAGKEWNKSNNESTDNQ